MDGKGKRRASPTIVEISSDSDEIPDIGVINIDDEQLESDDSKPVPLDQVKRPYNRNPTGKNQHGAVRECPLELYLCYQHLT